MVCFNDAGEFIYIYFMLARGITTAIIVDRRYAPTYPHTHTIIYTYTLKQVKKDYIEGLHDTLDLVPIAAWCVSWGLVGRKVGWYVCLIDCMPTHTRRDMYICSMSDRFGDWLVGRFGLLIRKYGRAHMRASNRVSPTT